jgi:K+-sensing histidine kinase KdpD
LFGTFADVRLEWLEGDTLFNSERESFTDLVRERWSDFVDAFYERLVKVWKLGRRLAYAIQQRPLLLKTLIIFMGLALSTFFALLFKPIVSPESQFLLYLPAVMVGALYAGIAGGVIATLVGAAATMFMFILPQREVHGNRPEETVALLLYFMAAAFILGLARAQEIQKKQVLDFTEALEHRVAERTADLQAANEELQSFCYSISHDLRTPMRNIVGSSRMIIEDLKEKLDEEAKANLLSIGASANRLAQLVDDLLNHARIGHATMKLERINLSTIATDLMAELEEASAENAGVFHVEGDMMLVCDAELMKLALRNLMENACKYRKRDRPLVVQLGETRRRGAPVFFVKDNGIGFEMQYVEKIFQPFQRLHRDVDYPGTGIGLANVRRIIERHEGAIWAEGELNVGSTFYFTVGKLRPEVAPPEVIVTSAEEEA